MGSAAASCQAIGRAHTIGHTLRRFIHETNNNRPLHRNRALFCAAGGARAVRGVPGAHDGDFDHQIVKFFRPQARQHGHLRAGFDLEHADGVGALNHCVHVRIVAAIQRGKGSGLSLSHRNRAGG